MRISMSACAVTSESTGLLWFGSRGLSAELGRQMRLYITVHDFAPRTGLFYVVLVATSALVLRTIPWEVFWCVIVIWQTLHVHGDFRA